MLQTSGATHRASFHLMPCHHRRRNEIRTSGSASPPLGCLAVFLHGRCERGSGEYILRARDGHTRFGAPVRLRAPPPEQHGAQAKPVHVRIFVNQLFLMCVVAAAEFPAHAAGNALRVNVKSNYREWYLSVPGMAREGSFEVTKSVRYLED